MRYTVIGFFKDNQQVWATGAEARDPKGAVRKAVLEMLKNNEWERDEADMLQVVEVVEGDAVFRLNNESVVDGSEFIGKGPKEWHPGTR